MKTDENITISRNVLMRLIKRNRQLIYMNFFLVDLMCDTQHRSCVCGR